VLELEAEVRAKERECVDAKRNQDTESTKKQNEVTQKLKEEVASLKRDLEDERQKRKKEQDTTKERHGQELAHLRSDLEKERGKLQVKFLSMACSVSLTVSKVVEDKLSRTNSDPDNTEVLREELKALKEDLLTKEVTLYKSISVCQHMC
jgi:hypothetical protein